MQHVKLPLQNCSHVSDCSLPLCAKDQTLQIDSTPHPQWYSLPHTSLPTGPFLTHKATTFGGSSGAPLFKVVQGEPVVVAMHCGCVPPTGPPQLNGGMLISHILHHVLTGSFKEGRLVSSFLSSFLWLYCAVDVVWPVATLASYWFMQTYHHWRRYWRNLLLHQLGEAHTARTIQVSMPSQHMIIAAWMSLYCAIRQVLHKWHVDTQLLCCVGPLVHWNGLSLEWCFLLSASENDGLLCT